MIATRKMMLRWAIVLAGLSAAGCAATPGKIWQDTAVPPIDARAGALMESIERQTALYADLEMVTGSYDKTARNFLAAIHLAASVVWLN